jgi:trehalose/maltose hydrolase-like predicted phosphorylase
MPTGRPSTAKSPSKNRKVNVDPNDVNGLQDSLHNMQLNVSEKEIEIERLKITVVSLNTKCTVVDDHIIDLNSTTARFHDSEINRQKLQDHIVEASIKIRTDNVSHTDYQSELQSEIEDMKRQLQLQRQEQH